MTDSSIRMQQEREWRERAREREAEKKRADLLRQNGAAIEQVRREREEVRTRQRLAALEAGWRAFGDAAQEAKQRQANEKLWSEIAALIRPPPPPQQEPEIIVIEAEPDPIVWAHRWW